MVSDPVGSATSPLSPSEESTLEVTRIPVSVFLITLNEAAHIERVLESVAWADEVIVVDSGSTDGTTDICERMGVQWHHQEWLGYSAQKAAALAKCRHSWCLNIDGDEIVPPELAAELQSWVGSNEISALEIPINDSILGKTLHARSRKRRIVRFFRAADAEYPTDRTVHENLRIRGKVLRAKHCLYHLGYDDPILYFSKQVKYAQLRAEDKFRAGKRGSLLKLWLIAPYSFFKTFVMSRLLLSGRAGLVISVAEAAYAFCKEAHLIKLSRGEPPRN